MHPTDATEAPTAFTTRIETTFATRTITTQLVTNSTELTDDTEKEQEVRLHCSTKIIFIASLLHNSVTKARFHSAM